MGKMIVRIRRQNIRQNDTWFTDTQYKGILLNNTQHNNTALSTTKLHSA
jgi:hypothetical protein